MASDAELDEIVCILGGKELEEGARQEGEEGIAQRRRQEGVKQAKRGARLEVEEGEGQGEVDKMPAKKKWRKSKEQAKKAREEDNIVVVADGGEKMRGKKKQKLKLNG